MRKAKRRIAQAAKRAATDASEARRVNNIVCRTKFFDDVIVYLAASGRTGADIPEAVVERLRVAADQAATDREQVETSSASHDGASPSASQSIRQVRGAKVCDANMCLWRRRHTPSAPAHLRQRVILAQGDRRLNCWQCCDAGCLERCRRAARHCARRSYSWAPAWTRARGGCPLRAASSGLK